MRTNSQSLARIGANEGLGLTMSASNSVQNLRWDPTLANLYSRHVGDELSSVKASRSLATEGFGGSMSWRCGARASAGLNETIYGPQF